MLLKIKSLTLLFSLLFSTIDFGNTPPVKERIDAIIAEYTSNINNLFSKQSHLINSGNNYFSVISPSLINDVLHSNDLKAFNLAINEKEEIGLNSYTILLAHDHRGKLKGEFIDKSIVIDECPISMKGKDVYLVTVKKELNFQNNTRVFDFIIGVDLDAEYPISFAYFNEVARSEKNILTNPSCSTDAQEEESRNIRKRQFKIYKDKANQYFINGEYYRARETYEKAKNINPEDQDVLDGIENSNHFIAEKRKKTILDLIDEKKIQDALVEINKAKKDDQLDEWYIEKFNFCTIQINLMRDQNELNRADILFENHQTKKALTIYQSLLNSKHLDQFYIKTQIKKCKESDPDYIKKALKKAYDEAVKSKKNYLSTFKTYSKYQNSGLLRGEQYYFMCLMMINKHSAVAKPMGYSRNQAKLLSRVYFYKAKDFGINVSFLETQIFTKNIENKKN